MPRPPGSCTPTTRTGIDGLTCPIPPLGVTLPTATLTATPQTIAPGQSATLTWSTSNATSVSINQGIGAVATSGTRSVSPATTTTYTMTATNGDGSVNATATVTVMPLPTVTFTASPTSIAPGGASTLTWSDQRDLRQHQSGHRHRGHVGHAERLADGDHDLHADRHQHRRVGDRNGHRDRRCRCRPSRFSASPLDHRAGAVVHVDVVDDQRDRRSINQGIGSVATSGTQSVSPATTTHLHADGHQRRGLGDRDGHRDRRAAAHDHVQRVTPQHRAGTVVHVDVVDDQRDLRQHQPGDRQRGDVRHSQRDAGGDDHLHADGHKRRGIGDRDRNRDRRADGAGTDPGRRQCRPQRRFALAQQD